MSVTERKDYRTLREKSRFAGAKRFASKRSFSDEMTAKDAIDNGGAGRAAKGATPTISTKKEKVSLGAFSFYKYYDCIVGVEGRNKRTREEGFAQQKKKK